MIEKPSVLTDPRYVYEFVEDWPSTTGTQGWICITSGTPDAGPVVSLFGYGTDTYGGVSLHTGTDAAGTCALYQSIASALDVPGTGDRLGVDVRLNIPALSVNGGDEFIFRVGLMNTNIGYWFEYDRDTSVNWRIHTGDGSTTNSQTTSTAVATGMLRLGLRADPTRADFYVNGTSVGTSTANLPASGDRYRPAYELVSTGGTGNKAVHTDYYALRHAIAGGRA